MKGKIVIIDVGKIFAHGWTKVLEPLELSYKVFKENGAVGIVFPSGDRNNVLSASDPNWGSSLLLMPGAQIGMEDFQFIRRSLEKGPVTMQFELKNTTTGPMQVNNVIAEIRGSELPDEWIIIGAHLDSWDYGTGAQDNGTGSVMVLDVARAIAAIGKAPRRSIRFALWGGEEQGLLGSYAYTQAHLNEMSKCVAVLNTDNGAGHPKGWKVESRKDVEDAMHPISDALLKDISGGGLSLETILRHRSWPVHAAGSAGAGPVGRHEPLRGSTSQIERHVRQSGRNRFESWNCDRSGDGLGDRGGRQTHC